MEFNDCHYALEISFSEIISNFHDLEVSKDFFILWVDKTNNFQNQ
jgi:hypothetical protein